MGQRRVVLLRAVGALIAGLLLARAAAAQTTKRPSWRTLETAHFRIHFYDDELALAHHAAAVGEHAFDIVTQRLNWRPSGRIDLTLTDATDSANGFASSRPRNFIYAFGAPPDSLSTLNDFDDWLGLLVTHELTHVVHLDIVLGIPRALNLLTGKTYAPNNLQPAWFIEGLAVVEESAQTTGGRIHNALFDMYLRTAVLEHRVLGLDQVSNGPRTFPYGTAAYLYGSSFVQYLQDRFGAAKLAELMHRYGKRVVPFGLNKAAREAFGLRFDELWDDWLADLERRYALDRDEIAARGLTGSRRLTWHGEGSAGGMRPRFLPTGEVVYLRTTSLERPAFVALDPRTGTTRVLARPLGAGPATIAADGRTLYHQQLAFARLAGRVAGNAFADWDDLHALDLATGETRPLSQGARLHEPDVSPDGRTLVATRTVTGVTRLVSLPADGSGPIRELGPREDGSIVYTPAFSPDGQSVAYVRWKPGGFRDVHVLDLRSGEDRALFRDRAIEADPQFSRDGRYLLFSSERTGVYNVFAYELATGRLRQVTNVLGGAFQPLVAPDGRSIVFVGFSADGYDLHVMPYEPTAWRAAEPAFFTREEPPTAHARPAVVERAYDYQAWRHLWPRQWEAQVASDPLGLGPTATLATSVDDPARLHVALLSANVPVTDGDVSARADYTYQGLWPSLSLTAARSALMAGGLVVDGQNRLYRQHGTSFAGRVGLPFLRRPDMAASLSLGYARDDWWNADRLPVPSPLEGSVRPPSRGPFASAFAVASFSNARSWNWSISEQEGRTLSLVLEHADTGLGSRDRSTTASWTWTEYITAPWAKLHVLALRYTGGASIGDRRDVFRLGGFVEQDLIRAFYTNRRQCCLFLRGYAPDSIAGTQFHAASAELRAPLVWIERGYRTFPVYLRRLHGAVFADAGHAFTGDFHPRDLRYGVGAELRLELKVAYSIETQLFVGVARGLSAGGLTDVYAASAIPF